MNKEKETLFFQNKKGDIINFEFDNNTMEINFTMESFSEPQITLDDHAIQTLKNFINRLELNDSNINLN